MNQNAEATPGEILYLATRRPHQANNWGGLITLDERNHWESAARKLLESPEFRALVLGSRGAA